MNKPLYRVEELAFDYTLDRQRVPALRGVTLEIGAGELVCLTGPSGSGKTTLLNILGLIEPLQKGEVWLAGKSFRGLSEADKNELRRRKLGFIFQSFQLFPVLSAEENVEFFLARQGIPRSERQKKVRDALSAVGLWEKHRAKRPLEMSGGQRQRVAVARALAKHPEVILADEPTASLDQKTGRELMETFRELNSRLGVTFIVSSHDPMVKELIPRKISLLDGELTGPESESHVWRTQTHEEPVS